MKRVKKIVRYIRKSWFFDLWWIAFPPYLEENEEIIFCNNCAMFYSSFDMTEDFKSCKCQSIIFKLKRGKIITKEVSNNYRIRK